MKRKKKAAAVDPSEKSSKLFKSFTNKLKTGKRGGGTLEEMDEGNPVFLAAKAGDVALVKSFLESGSAVSSTNNSVLEIAAKNGHVDILRLLLLTRRTKARLANATSARMTNAVILAAQNGHLDVVQFFYVTSCVDQLLLDQLLDTLMTEAVENGHLHVAKYLMKKYVRKYQEDTAGDIIVQNAAANGRMNFLEWFRTLSDTETFLDATTSVEIAICMATENDQTDAVDFLLKMLVENDTLCFDDILYNAVMTGSVKAFDFAISNGAVLRYSNQKLLHAAMGGHVEMARKLVNLGAHLPEYHVFCFNFGPQAVETLQQPLDVRNQLIPIVSKEKILQFASFNGFADIVRLLLADKQTNVNWQCA